MKSSRSNCLHSKSVFLFCPNPATKLPEYPIYNWEGYEYFVNAGAFTKIQSTNTTTISVAFTNSGSVVAQNGTISFGGMTSLGGSFLTTNNAAVYGVLAGTFSGMLNWTGGSISGGSSLTVASNGVLNINPGGSTTLNLYGVLTNYGTVNWLSADGTRRVLLLEYGGSDRSIFIQMPSALSIPMNMPKYNWFYHTEPEPHLNGSRRQTTRGKVL